MPQMMRGMILGEYRQRLRKARSLTRAHFLATLLCCGGCWLEAGFGDPAGSGRLVPEGLRCEWTLDPLGVDAWPPRLSWQLSAPAGTYGKRQSAWQVQAATSLGRLTNGPADLWESGKVTSDETVGLSFGGRGLGSSEQAFWRVRVWDEGDRPSAWSRPATWTMGVLASNDWRAKWIGSVANEGSSTLRLRREVRVRPALRRALIHVCGLGHYVLRMNGQRVGEALLTPGWTRYDKTCLYDTHDVTALMHEGPNAVGIELAGGMYRVVGGRYTKFTGQFGPLKAIAQLYLDYADGSVETVGTDEHWQVTPGPITFSCIYGGEDYDARLETPGWDRPGFVASGWQVATVLAGPGGILRGASYAAPPLRWHEVLKPVASHRLTPAVTVYDLGQNASVMLRIRVRGERGSRVKVVPAELRKTDGTVDRASCGAGQGEASWNYVAAGEAEGETWEPAFFYHGSRYLEVTCMAAGAGGPLPEVVEIEGRVTHSASEPAGEFSCSKELFNRTRTLIRWAQRSNLAHVITDCPHRERLGWLEQYHLHGPSLRYEWDLARLYAKSLQDMADSQTPEGLIPDIAPEYVVFQGGFRDSPEWGSAAVLVPWQQYLWSGDDSLLRGRYETMRGYLAYLRGRAKGNLLQHGLGDWYDLGPNPPGVAQLTPIALTASAFYFEVARIVAEAARISGRNEDAAGFSVLAAEVRAAFNRAFYDGAKGRYATGSQTAQALPLVMDLVEESQRARVVDALVADVRQHGLTAGDVGHRFLLRALADAGRSEVVDELHSGSDRPGYGYILERGATALTEAWDARRDSSHNHFMLGHIVEWFYHDLAGIRPDPSGPGFKRILIKPTPVGDLTWVRARYQSVRGPIRSAWRREGARFELEVEVPPNATATVYVPGEDVHLVEGSSNGTADARRLTRQGDATPFRVGSGRYGFESLLSSPPTR